jgi:hypothetical protein
VKSSAKKSHESNPDVLVANAGTVFTFCPLTARAKLWIEENVETGKHVLTARDAVLNSSDRLSVETMARWCRVVTRRKALPCAKTVLAGCGS